MATDKTRSDWAWDVTCLKFYDTAATELRGTAIDSAHVAVEGYGPTAMLAKTGRSCFTDLHPMWGGRRNGAREFYVGMDMARSVSVGRVEVWQHRGRDHNTFEVRLESSSNGDDWKEVVSLRWNSEQDQLTSIRCGISLAAKYVQ